MTEDEIWRQIRSLVRPKILDAYTARRRKDNEVLVGLSFKGHPEMPELTVLEPKVDYYVEAATQFCEEVYSICDQVREQVGLEMTPEFERAVFRDAIKPQLWVERRTATFDISGDLTVYRGITQARHQDISSDGGEVHGSPAKATLSELADVPP